MKCPKCGQEKDLCEKDTSSGRDIGTRVCRRDKWAGVDSGVALWKVRHDVRK
jgi:hypothetical protein